ncbi:MAG: hypothetical protein GXO73_12245 [Calditrichaeota bacterium]|nr:hypothetical protein [Calditrichota bacterium]
MRRPVQRRFGSYPATKNTSRGATDFWRALATRGETQRRPSLVLFVAGGVAKTCSTPSLMILQMLALWTRIGEYDPLSLVGKSLINLDSERIPSVRDEFEAAWFGDARLSRRLQQVAEAADRTPDSSFPKMAKSAAELEGTYRFLNNDSVTPAGILAPHFAASANRGAKYGRVLVLHDTSEFRFSGDGERNGLGVLAGGGDARGFYGHFSLAVAPGKTRDPLGLVSVLGSHWSSREAFSQEATRGYSTRIATLGECGEVFRTRAHGENDGGPCHGPRR